MGNALSYPEDGRPSACVAACKRPCIDADEGDDSAGTSPKPVKSNLFADLPPPQSAATISLHIDAEEAEAVKSVSIEPPSTTILSNNADAPMLCGLLIHLDETGSCWMQFVKDNKLSHIHPNIHVPEFLEDLEELGGGGSGATIIKGAGQEFGSVVMKHGGHKETEETFALATLKEQLRLRGDANEEAKQGASRLQARLSGFEFIYVSQPHIRERGSEMWAPAIQKLKAMWMLQHLGVPKGTKDSNDPASPTSARSPENSARKRRGIRVCDLACSKKVELFKDRLEIHLDADTEFDTYNKMRCNAVGEGYTYLEKFVGEFMALQKEHKWKITLAQKTIGGSKPKTASKILTSGMLEGPLLTTLIDEFLSVMRDLQCVTLPSEHSAAVLVRKEVQAMNSVPENQSKTMDCDPSKVSDLADCFVGFAIKKNFHREKGRFKLLRDMGEWFRGEHFHPTEDETLPAHFLGLLLKSGAQMEDVFATGPTGQTALDMYCDCWRDLLEHATSVESVMALESIWNCGLVDCGLHNIFLSEESLYLFDTGAPSLMPLPAFLTKFLFSFFHALGMEEDSLGSWVNRFKPAGSKLKLTDDTKTLFPKVVKAFKLTLRCFVRQIFDDEKAVCDLLGKYVVLQLLSDAAFCLERFQMKHGNGKRQPEPDQSVNLEEFQPQPQVSTAKPNSTENGEPSVKAQHRRSSAPATFAKGSTFCLGLERWLWRALWDLYIATEVANEDWYDEVEGPLPQGDMSLRPQNHLYRARRSNSSDYDDLGAQGGWNIQEFALPLLPKSDISKSEPLRNVRTA